MLASPIDRLPRPLAVAIHDAGAANMIIAWASAAKYAPDRVWAKGPARTLWEARFGTSVLVDEGAEALLEEMSCLLSGTGWASDLEHSARQEAARRGMMSVAVIDHWVNYAMRFERNGRCQLPDIVWVGDRYAAQIVHEKLPGQTVEQFSNFYLAEQAAGAGPLRVDGDILFVAEPARSTWGKGSQGEFQVLDHFWQCRTRAGVERRTPMRIRPHPSDPPGKYDEWLASHYGTSLDRSPDMATALGPARWVVGLNSVALVIALEAGRQAISALPPHAPPCTLPHKGIMRL